jgi:hypothetical protein
VSACIRCKETLRGANGEALCGFCRAELREAAIDNLREPAPQRTYAIWFLRDEGFSPAAVVGAVRAAERGYGRDIVAGLLEAV